MAWGRLDHGVTGVAPVGDVGITKLIVAPDCTMLQ
jgi:hypothetical protein